MIFLTVTLRSLLWLVMVGYGLTQDQGPSPSPFCPTPNGDFPNPASETCASFFRCVQGRPLALRCPTDEVFDFLLRRCASSDDVNCERQLQIFAAPSAADGNGGSFGAHNGLSSFSPFLNGQTSDSNQFSFRNRLPQGVYDHLLTQLQGQQNAQGQNGLLQPNPLGQGANVQPKGAGQQGLAAGVLASGISVAPDGQLTAAGKAIGHMYPTSSGTVIVINKQVPIPNIQKLNTVPINQQGTQQTTVTGSQGANQQSRNVQPQPTSSNQQGQGDVNYPNQPRQSKQAAGHVNTGDSPISQGSGSPVDNLVANNLVQAPPTNPDDS